MFMRNYIASDWKEVLAHNQLASFDQLWELDADWFEEPNRRRGGWSGVSRIELLLPSGGKVGFFLKRQENHIYKSLSHPLRGEATFLREVKNIQRFSACGVPTLELVFFEQRSVKGKLRAILVTRELVGYAPLTAQQFSPGHPVMRSLKRKKALLSKLADLMRRMHENHFQHNCFYPKHVFACVDDDGNIDTRVIDLEKVKWSPFKHEAMFRDLDTLNRHTKGWSLSDRMRFLKFYVQETKLSEKSKKLWRKLAKRSAQKST
jgi:hypothetical protein